MTESQLVNEWLAEARRKGETKGARSWLLRVLDVRFPGAVPAEVREIITKQDNLQILEEWYDVALKAFSFDEFRAHVIR